MNGLEPSNLSAEYDRVPQRSPVAATRVSLGEWSTVALFAERFEQDIQVITKLKKNIKNRLMSLMDKVLLCRRATIESVIDQLNPPQADQIEHTRRRSLANFMVNLGSDLAAYCHQPKKQSLHVDTRPVTLLALIHY